MKTRTLPLASALLAFAFVATATQAQTTATAKAPDASSAAQPCTFDDCVKEIKKPVDWFSWGGDFRARNEYYNNIVTLDEAAPLHDQDVVRYRARLWASLTPVADLSLNGRLAAEPRLWIDPSFSTATKDTSGMEWRYGIVNNLNVKWNNAFNQPLTITAGRQDIMLGDYYDWWLVSDGTPADGSWTFFLDSIRLTADAKDIKTKFDLIYIYQNAKPDYWLPTIGSANTWNVDHNGRTDYQLMEQNEQGAIVYVSNSSIKDTKIDGYFIYKRDNNQTFLKYNTTTLYGDNANIYTIGGKITGTPEEHWQYSVEGAYQFGSKEDKISGVFAQRDIDAYGAKTKLTYLFKDHFDCQLSLVGEVLSGDNPKTGRDEMFDVLWGRWPRWSELYIYSYINETSGKIAQMNNLGRVGPSFSCNPMKGTTATIMYNAMFALEETPTRTVAPTLFTDNGNFRGHYLQAILKHQFNKYVSAHLWGEFVWQGDYYAHQDMTTFLRGEVMFSF